MTLQSLTAALLLLFLASVDNVEAFAPLSLSSSITTRNTQQQQLPNQKNGAVVRPQQSFLKMALDPVTYLRTEWIAAALCTNQTPRSADVLLQLGCQDGRAVTFVPRTVRQFITSTVEPDGQLPQRVERQLKQSEDRRQAAKVVYVNQRADDLSETKDESVDVVISLQAVQTMVENQLDWKQGVREAARVLKPGGRLLWVEPTEINGESFIDYVESLVDVEDESILEQEGVDIEKYLVFDDIGYDDIDFILQPHTAGVAVKSLDAGMTLEEREQKIKLEEDEKMAELTIEAYERGIKKKKRKKKKKKAGIAEQDA